MPSVLIDYIKQYGLESLCKRFAIKAKYHSAYPNLVLLKYSQIDSPFEEEIVQYCRGIILDQDDGWRIIAYPYKKFFNHEESLAAEIDWESAKIYEKLDGSLMTLYYYDYNWLVSSSGLPDASGNVLDSTKTFAELFWHTWDNLKYNLPLYKDIHKCYMFELMTPYNRVVVKHDKSKIVLHGVRDLNTLRELNPIVEGHVNGWQTVSIKSFNSLEQIIQATKTLDPMKGEGFVVADKNFNRIKVKSAQYRLWAKQTDGMSTRRIIEEIRANETSEFLPKFIEKYPEYINQYAQILSSYNIIVGEISGYYDAIKHIDDRKEFAKMATRKWYSDVLFSIKFGQYSIKECLANMQIKRLEEKLNINYKLL